MKSLWILAAALAFSSAAFAQSNNPNPAATGSTGGSDVKSSFSRPTTDKPMAGGGEQPAGSGGGSAATGGMDSDSRLTGKGAGSNGTRTPAMANSKKGKRATESSPGSTRGKGRPTSVTSGNSNRPNSPKEPTTNTAPTSNPNQSYQSGSKPE